MQKVKNWANKSKWEKNWYKKIYSKENKNIKNYYNYKRNPNNSIKK